MPTPSTIKIPRGHIVEECMNTTPNPEVRTWVFGPSDLPEKSTVAGYSSLASNMVPPEDPAKTPSIALPPDIKEFVDLADQGKDMRKHTPLCIPRDCDVSKYMNTKPNPEVPTWVPGPSSLSTVVLASNETPDAKNTDDIERIRESFRSGEHDGPVEFYARALKTYSSLGIHTPILPCEDREKALINSMDALGHWNIDDIEHLKEKFLASNETPDAKNKVKLNPQVCIKWPIRISADDTERILEQWSIPIVSANDHCTCCRADLRCESHAKACEFASAAEKEYSPSVPEPKPMKDCPDQARFRSWWNQYSWHLMT